MTDQNRWSDDRYGDRDRQEDYRTENDRSRDPYGRDFGQDRNRNRGYGADRSGYGESGDAYRAGGQSHGGGSRGYEDRSFWQADRSADSYGSAYGGVGEDV